MPPPFPVNVPRHAIFFRLLNLNFMISFITNWWQQRIIAQNSVTAEEWDNAFNKLPLLNHLSPEERQRLRKLCILFVHQKTFIGAQDFQVNQDIQLHISLQACLPILNLGIDWYAGWTSIIVYPAGFRSERVITDEYGVTHTVSSENIGEAWQHGPLLLSWDDAEGSGDLDGRNVVIHEFVHKLDMLNGSANGFPPMHKRNHAEQWSKIFSLAFEDFQSNPKPGIDRYGATNPAEFFAVLSEVFFEKPHRLQDAYPDVFLALRQFYKQDPTTKTGV